MHLWSGVEKYVPLDSSPNYRKIECQNAKRKRKNAHQEEKLIETGQA